MGRIFRSPATSSPGDLSQVCSAQNGRCGLPRGEVYLSLGGGERTILTGFEAIIAREDLFVNDVSEIDVAILTVLPEEYQAVYRRLKNPQIDPGTSGPNIYAWATGEANCINGGSYRIAVGMMGRAGTNMSAVATKDAISRWKPKYVFFVGIAGGFDLGGLRKGDVVIADVIYGYEYGKVENDFLPRHNWVYRTDLSLLNGATAFAITNQAWANELKSDHPKDTISRVVTGEVASGDKVIDDPSNEFFRAIRASWPKLQAVEMEGAGACATIEEAAATGLAVGFLMIRGISDMPRPDTRTEVRGTAERNAWKNYAAEAAAAFTIAYITNGLPVPPRNVQLINSGVAFADERLIPFQLQDENDLAFGKSEFTANLGFARDYREAPHEALHYVAIVALPVGPVATSPVDVIRSANQILVPERWYNTRSDLDVPPRYWPLAIFEIPPTKRIARHAAFWEYEDRHSQGTLSVSKLAITDTAEVVFASSFLFTDIVREWTPVFQIGRILAECWKLSGLTAQFHKEIGYVGKTAICIGMVNTHKSHLASYADKWLEPYNSLYWADVSKGCDWSCHSPNLRFLEIVDLMDMEPKVQPKFIKGFGEAISLAYNQDTPRCFERETGMIPARYFNRLG